MTEAPMHADPLNDGDREDWRELTGAIYNRVELGLLTAHLQAADIEYVLEPAGYLAHPDSPFHYTAAEFRVRVHPDDLEDAQQALDAIVAERRGRTTVHASRVRRFIFLGFAVTFLTIAISIAGSTFDESIRDMVAWTTVLGVPVVFGLVIFLRGRRSPHERRNEDA